MNSIQKLCDFFPQYNELYINEEIRKIMLRNTHAMYKEQYEKGISFDPEKIDKKDYEKIKELAKELDGIICLKNFINNMHLNDTYFCDFNLLSKYLLISKMNVKDCFDIILQFIKYNIENKQLGLNCLENKINVISFEKYSNLSYEEKQEILKHSKQLKVLIFDQKKSKIFKKVIFDDLLQVINQINIIEEFYLNKKDSFDLDDIDKIIEAFLKLKIDKQLVEKIKNLLKKEFDKRNNEVKEVKINIKPQTVKKTNVLTEQEYKVIRKELRKYFDFHKVEVIRELTEEEIIHCIELLIKIDTPINEIQRFIYFTKMDDEEYKEKNISLLEDKNPIALYVTLYNKLKYYEKQIGSEKLVYIKQCLEEMFICDNEEYEFYKQEIEEELKKILVLLPQTYDYEINEIGKRIKFEK